MAIDRSDAVHADLVQRPDAAEALAWLKDANDPEERVISGGDGSETAWLADEALRIVQELYKLGAVTVTAVEIEDLDEQATHQDTSTLIIELPEDAAKRTQLFAWGSGFAYGTGWDPETDKGQKYLLVRRD